jgi:hypothetical protein
MAKSYIESSLDSYPVEFLNMQKKHILVYGEDVLRDISFQPVASGFSVSGKSRRNPPFRGRLSGNMGQEKKDQGAHQGINNRLYIHLQWALIFEGS